MCIGVCCDEAKQRRTIKRMAKKNGYIRLYKVILARSDCYTPVWFEKNLHQAGIQEAKYLHEEDGGWYTFKNERDAEFYLSFHGHRIIECLARPAWVKCCKQDENFGTIIVLTHLCFPKHPATKVTVREFKRLVKEYERGK